MPPSMHKSAAAPQLVRAPRYPVDALLADIGDNISPGPFPRPPVGGQPAVPFPYRQTRICPIGPSAVAPVLSSILLIGEDHAAHVHKGRCTAV